jgi:hypothetical protein
MQTLRLPMNYGVEFRSDTTDKGSKMVNCYADDYNGTMYAKKRPGYVSSGVDFGTGTAQGLYTYANRIYATLNNTLYRTDLTTTTTVGTLTGTVTPCYFTNTLNDGYMFFQKGDYGYTYDGTTLARIRSDGVAFITVTTGGTLYSSVPTVTFGPEWAATTAYTVNQQIAYGANLYTVTVAGTTASTAPTFTSGSQVDGTATLTYAGTRATGTAVISSGTVTSITITDAGTGYNNPPTITISAPGGAGIQALATCLLNGFPTGNIVPGTSYFDTYVFVMTEDGKIWNSEPNDPTKWDALNYITAEAEPDKGVALAKHFNYLIAFGQWSTEFFYDAGNAVGSPLLPNPTFRIEFGCANGNSVVEMQQTVVWVAVGRNTGRTVLMLEGTRPVPISDVSIERILNQSSLTNVRSYSLKISGHYFYVLNLLDDDLTLVCDIKSKQWSIWTSFVDGQENILDGVFYTSYNNEAYALDNDNGVLYNISEHNYTDLVGPIQYRIRTPLIDAQSTMRKFIGRLEVVGDKIGATLRIRHTDDDYQNWSQYRNVDLNATRSVLYQNGNFRRRAYEFFCTDNQPLRLQALEMDLDAGTN